MARPNKGTNGMGVATKTTPFAKPQCVPPGPLNCPDHPGSPMPDDSLYDATYRLDELLRDSWRYKAEFEYDVPGAG